MKIRIDWSAIAIGVVTLAVVFWFFAVAPYEDITDNVTAVEESVFDQYQRWKPRPYATPDPADPDGPAYPPPVLVIDVDEASLAKLGQWPWPRFYIAEMLRRLNDAGAAVVALDIVFSEPDRTSPANVRTSYQRFGDVYGLRSLAPSAAMEVDHDRILGDMIGQTYTVLSAFPTNNAQHDRLPPRPSGIAVKGGATTEDLSKIVEHYAGATVNLPILSQDAKGIGMIALGLDTGITVRSVPMAITVADDPYLYPALAIEALRVAQDTGSFVVRTTAAEDGGLGQVAIADMQVGAAVVPLEANGQLRIRYSRAIEERVIPAHEILAPGGMSPETEARVAGQIIFVGSSAETLFDIRRTPIHDRISGVHVHAEIAEQILQQDFLSLPDWAEGVERLAMIVGGLIIILIVGNNMPVLGFVALLALLGAIGGGSWYAFSENNLLLSPVGPALAVVLPHFVVSGFKYFRSETSRREVNRQFEHFVSPEVIADIAEDPEKYLTPGGAQRNLSIMFLDVRRFSTITEKMNPQEVIAFINTLLTPLTDAIIENEGTIDKYMGDAVMAFWNAPRETGSHEMKATRAMLAFNPIMDELNKTFRAQGLPDIDIGTGINSGECSVGNMGSLKRLAYSCVGDAVNLAARLEGQTKAYGVKNLVGSATAAGLKGFAAIEIDSVAVKGRTQPETIFTVAGDESVASQPDYERVAGAIAGARSAYLEQLWDAADVAFREISDLPQVGCFDPKPFAEAFLARIADYRENPPGADWDGVYVATSK